MQTFFLTISVILPLISPIVYIRSMVREEAKPHRTTRMIYLLITALSTWSLYSAGNTIALWISGASFIQSFVVFLMSLKYGIGGFEKSSMICLCCAIAGIVLWQITDNPMIGLYSSIIADFFGAIPTIWKTSSNPETEDPKFYMIDSISAVFNILANSTFTFHSILYPLYLVCINTTIALLAFRKK